MPAFPRPAPGRPPRSPAPSRRFGGPASLSAFLHLGLGALALLLAQRTALPDAAPQAVEVVFAAPAPSESAPPEVTPPEPPPPTPEPAQAAAAAPPPEPAMTEQAAPSPPAPVAEAAPPSEPPAPEPPAPASLAMAPPSPEPPPVPAPAPVPPPAEPSIPTPPVRPARPTAQYGPPAPPRPAPHPPPPRPATPATPTAPVAVPVPALPAAPVRPAAPLAQAPPSTPAPAAPAVISPQWSSALAAWVQSRRRYPDDARRRNLEGQVAVRITVARTGEVTEAQLVRSSGAELLDQAALTMFRGGRAPPFPPDMPQPQVTRTVAVRYQLDD